MENLTADEFAELKAREWTDADDALLTSHLWTYTNFAAYNVDLEWRHELEGENAWILKSGHDPTSDFYRKNLGNRDWWQAIRRETAATVNDVAEYCGVDRSTVTRWEQGRRDPSGDNAGHYKTWLKQAREEILGDYQKAIIRMAARRDDWPHWPTGQEAKSIWNQFWRAGGWYDAWQSRGELANTNRLQPWPDITGHLTPV